MRVLVTAVLVASCGSSPAPTTTAAAPSTQKDAPLEQRVDVNEWFCMFHHANDLEARDLVIPADRAVRLTITGRQPERTSGRHPHGGPLHVMFEGEPLIVAPGATVTVDLPPQSVGTRQWECPVESGPEGWPPNLETLQIVSPAGYTAHLADLHELKFPSPATVVRMGRQSYEKRGCAGCHTVDGTPRVGPSWKGLWGTTVELDGGTQRVVDRAYVEQSIMDPRAAVVKGFSPVMPSFDGALRSGELAALVAYIESLQ